MKNWFQKIWGITAVFLQIHSLVVIILLLVSVGTEGILKLLIIKTGWINLHILSSKFVSIIRISWMIVIGFAAIIMIIEYYKRNKTIVTEEKTIIDVEKKTVIEHAEENGDNGEPINGYVVDADDDDEAVSDGVVNKYDEEGTIIGGEEEIKEMRKRISYISEMLAEEGYFDEREATILHHLIGYNATIFQESKYRAILRNFLQGCSAAISSSKHYGSIQEMEDVNQMINKNRKLLTRKLRHEIHRRNIMKK